MKGILTAILLAVILSAPSLAEALMIRWQPVTIGFDGQLLQNQVTQYHVYRCNGTNVVCTKANGVKIGSVQPSIQFLDISAQPVPSSYFVTAQNIVGESAESTVQRAVQPRTVQGVTLTEQ